MNPLCDFAHRFPDFAARILHRDRHKRRNFREETITDLLMAGLTAFEPYGVRVDFPLDESATGEDMDWEFVDPYAKDGRRYLRLHIQAKRAVFRPLKQLPSYWHYDHLDHEAKRNSGRGSQAASLLAGAAVPGCVPLYMFYHSLDALQSAGGGLPRIAGVNAILASHLLPVLRRHPPKPGNARWPVDLRKVDRWRPHFMQLSDLLYFEVSWRFQVSRSDDGLELVAGPGGFGFSPGTLADSLNEYGAAKTDLDGSDHPGPIEAIDDIPAETMRAIEIGSRGDYRFEIKRPRAIFLNNGLTIDSEQR